jgi:hypothetical protein
LISLFEYISEIYHTGKEKTREDAFLKREQKSPADAGLGFTFLIGGF